MSFRPDLLRLLFLATELTWLAGVLILFESLVRLVGAWPLATSLWLYPAALAWSAWSRRLPLPARFKLALEVAVLVSAVALSLKPLFPGAWAEPFTILWTWPGWRESLDWPVEIKRLLLALLFGGFLWIRGLYLARRVVDHAGLKGGFQAGLVVWLIVLPLSAVAKAPVWPLGLLVSAFFGLGLAGLWLGSRRDSAGPGPLVVSGPWLVCLVLAVGLVLTAGVVILALVDHDFLNLVLQPIYWLGRQIGRLIEYLLSLIPKPEPNLMPPGRGGSIKLPSQGDRLPWADWIPLRRIGEVMVIFGWSTLFGVTLFRFLSDLLRWLRRRAGIQDVAVESVSGGFRADLLALLGWLWNLIRRLWPRRGRPAMAFHPASPEAASIREVYGRFLAWGEKIGLPRPAHQTPYEYQSVLTRRLPDHTPDLAAITEAFVQARYNPRASVQDRLETVRSCLRRLKSACLERPETSPDTAVAPAAAAVEVS